MENKEESRLPKHQKINYLSTAENITSRQQAIKTLAEFKEIEKKLRNKGKLHLYLYEKVRIESTFDYEDSPLVQQCVINSIN